MLLLEAPGGGGKTTDEREYCIKPWQRLITTPCYYDDKPWTETLTLISSGI